MYTYIYITKRRHQCSQILQKYPLNMLPKSRQTGASSCGVNQKLFFWSLTLTPMSLFKEVCSAPEVYLFRYSCVAKSHVSYNESCL